MNRSCNCNPAVGESYTQSSTDRCTSENSQYYICSRECGVHSANNSTSDSTSNRHCCHHAAHGKIHPRWVGACDGVAVDEAVFVVAERIARVACKGIESLPAGVGWAIPPCTHVIETCPHIVRFTVVKHRRPIGCRLLYRTQAVMNRDQFAVGTVRQPLCDRCVRAE